jgi:hypothetical protein
MFVKKLLICFIIIPLWGCGTDNSSARDPEIQKEREVECCECLIENHCAFSEEFACVQAVKNGGDVQVLVICEDLLCAEVCDLVGWGPTSFI